MRKTFLAAFLLCFAFVASASATEFSGDMTTIMAGQTSPGKIYYKNSKTMRQEMMGMMGMIIITKYPFAYQLFQGTKRYVVVDMEELKKQNPMIDVDNFEEWVEKNDMKKVGTESVQGYKCVVYEGDIKFTEDQPAMPMKFWYSKKLGYWIKSEIGFPAPMGKMTSTIENIKIGKQPADLFEIPSGYTEAKDVQEAMGLGSFSMPSGSDSGQMPSEEERGEMMKSIQEMKKGMQDQ